MATAQTHETHNLLIQRQGERQVVAFATAAEFFGAEVYYLNNGYTVKRVRKTGGGTSK